MIAFASTMEVDVFQVIQVVVTGGFAVGMLLGAAKVRELTIATQKEMVCLENRILEKIDNKLDNVHNRIDVLATAVSKIEGKLDNNGNAKVRKE